METSRLRELRQTIAKAMMKLERAYGHYCHKNGHLDEVQTAAAELQDFLAEAAEEEECE